MNRSENLIDMELQSIGCSVISPGYQCIYDKFGIVKDKIDRNKEKIMILEGAISYRMKTLYQKNISENLNEKAPIMYIDCNEKGSNDIMFFLFKQCIERITSANKIEIASKIIEKRKAVVLNSDDRNIYLKEHMLNLEGLFDYYSKQLVSSFSINSSEYVHQILNHEVDIALDGLREFMEDQNTRYLYLYLDKIESLTIDEQKRVNILLYLRGEIDRDKRWIHLKINNGSNRWKSWSSSSGKRVETPHDYSDKRIYEGDL